MWCCLFSTTSLLSFVLAFAVLLLVQKWQYLILVLKTLPRDFIGIITLIKVQGYLKRHLKRQSTVDHIFGEVVNQNSAKVAIVSVDSGKTWTFSDVEKFTNKVGNFFQAEGLFKEGDVIGLYMNNCLEYMGLWLGLSKLGVVTALINYNLRQEPLGHCVKIAKVKAIICDTSLYKAIADAMSTGHIDPTPVYVYGQAEGFKLENARVINLESALAVSSANPVSAQLNVNCKSILFYIYTSGTTGLPKAAIITHARYMMMARGVHVAFRMSSSDRVYVTMPLYHSAAGILGTGQVLLSGATMVLRKKFSASSFWDDCVQYQCTVSQYIGEICRYLLAQPVKPAEQKHVVRMMFGNGLRPAIWQEFVTRFRISRIGEFYGSTEGNNNLLNLDNKVGACGFLPIYQWLGPLYPVAIVKIDQTTGQHARDKNGLCVRCRPGETGEIVGKIIKGDPVKDFQGYLSGNDTSKKIIQNVFTKGDFAFSSGDILYMDEMGYLYFKDRVGDTFRWKGENVSTCEVESIIHSVLGNSDATVYGVEIPGSEGRAGMAAVVDVSSSIDFKQFNTNLKAKLPAYARPVFIRICKSVDMTGTYKLKKADLLKEGYDPSRCRKDHLFYLSSKTGEYESLTETEFERINRGEIQF